LLTVFFLKYTFQINLNNVITHLYLLLFSLLLISIHLVIIGAAEKIFEIMDRKPAVNYQGGIRPELAPKGNVSFEDVSFSYPSRPDLIVLKSFTLRIHAGQQIALVGASGSGKSTVLSVSFVF